MALPRRCTAPTAEKRSARRPCCATKYADSVLRTTKDYSTDMLHVINHKPRTYSLAEANLLQRLGTVVMRLLSLRLLQ